MSEESQSPTIGKLADALSKAQGEMRNARKDATNPHFRNSYATLASVLDAVREPLSRHGLALVQTMEAHGDAGVCVVSTLMHSSGEWIRGRLFVPASKKDAQGFGGAITYARRYSAAGIVGISQDDDDGESASALVGTRAPPLPSSDPGDSELEAELRSEFGRASSVDEIAALSARVAEAVRSRRLTKGARERLRAPYLDATRRVRAA